MSLYNIMTSCDDGLIHLIPVQLAALSENLKNEDIDFYLLHSGISGENIDTLRAFCRELKNISFHDIVETKAEEYDTIVRYGGGWPKEAYYSIRAHKLLPETVDRVMYLDAGDTLVLGDISPYYNYDFKGKTIIATIKKFKNNNGVLGALEKEDLGNKEFLQYFMGGIFNSGSYVMNIEKMREDNMDIADFTYLAEMLKEVVGNLIFKDKRFTYWGDEGILSAAYVGDIRYYAFPEIQDPHYTPYNFCLWVNPPAYRPSVVHYVGGSEIKPWNIKYPVFFERFQKMKDLNSIDELKPGHAKYYYQWHIYASIADKILDKIGC